MKVFMKSGMSAILIRLLIPVAAAMTLSLLVNQMHDMPTEASDNKNEAVPISTQLSLDYLLKVFAFVHDVSIQNHAVRVNEEKK